MIKLLLWTVLASAVTLPEIGPAQLPALEVDPSAPLYPCDEVVARLRKFNDMNLSHQNAMVAFIGEVAQKVETWHALLKPLETTQGPIVKDTFEPLRQGADQLYMISGMASDNASLLATELDRVLQSLAECKIQSQ